MEEKEKLMASVHVNVHLIYKWAQTRFHFSFFFFSCSFSLSLVLWVSAHLYILSISLKSCFCSLHIFPFPWPFHHLPSLSLALSPPSLLFLTIPGQLYSLLNQYFNEVCKNCRTTRPDTRLYDFIYGEVSSSATGDTSDSAKDSEMSSLTLDSQ